ncbi:peptidoglycan-binding domain 1 [Scytonema sp. HK-05]|uniref:peptidoglycan-binding domain-containing protein n=1 Tax=Scytonema sp. HK-05 TaxID=1137095 RepID=UPI0009359A32|nr:peptidoglycan-binding protein [Scytonema sp. HK-05]OKH60883.1 peptidoglycan-binding protein [Scytonema sp. HK-05]BAY45199.1 peptidoglycan-binding domain 1 [Scytonema sp. HK-05]
MEKIGYLQFAEANEASIRNEDEQVQVNYNLFAQLNWKTVSSCGAIHLLSVALTLAVLSIAQRAVAVEKVGSSGSQVSEIQRCLSKLGYYNGPVTGKFASLTQNAVIRFQQTNGLPAVGVVGARTQQALQSQCQSRRPGGSVSGGLQPGSRGQAVTRLQQDLRRLGYFNGPITGNFGPETQRAVVRFQQSYGIRADGVVGGRTKEAIRISLNRNNSSAYNSSAYNSSTYNSSSDNSSTYTSTYTSTYNSSDGIGGDNLPNALNLGDSGAEVRELQQDLQQLGYFRVNPTGYFGPTTQEAVARFQQDYRIVPSGVADSQTLGAITTALGGQNYGQNPGQNYGQNPGQNPGQNYGCSTTGDICQGERSRRVTVVQQRLQNLRFFNGDITGYYGPATRDAVAQFQRYYGLETTGFVNYQTWQALGISNNPDNSTGWSPKGENRFVVVVPISRNDTLDQVRQYIPEAFRAESRLGPFVNAGQFRERSQAEDLSKWLRSRGLDARVDYF